MADAYDAAEATKRAKKLTSATLRVKLSAHAQDTAGLKPDLVARWVETERALEFAKRQKRITGETLIEAAAAVGWRQLAGYVDWATRCAFAETSKVGDAAGRELDAAPEWWQGYAFDCCPIDEPEDRDTVPRTEPVPEGHSCWPLFARVVSAKAERRLGLAWPQRLDRSTAAVHRRASDRVGKNIQSLAEVAIGEATEAVAVCCDGDVGSLRPRLWMPSLETSLELPLDPDALRALIKKAGERAPLGKGTETVVDLDARRTWRFGLGSDVLATSPDWTAAFAASGGSGSDVLDEVKRKLVPGLSGRRGQVVAQPYQMLIYEEGDFFAQHRDTARGPSHFGSLVVNLPVRGGAEGGDLVVRGRGDAQDVVLAAAAPDGPPLWAAFYADVAHEVRPVVHGLRVTLTYHLHAAGFGEVPRLPTSLLREGEVGTLKLLGAALNWAHTFYTDSGDGITLTFALAHQYTETTLPTIQKTDDHDRRFSTRDPARLRGRDAVLFATLKKALSAFCGPNQNDSDFESDAEEVEELGPSDRWIGEWRINYKGLRFEYYGKKPPLIVELINIRDFRPPRGGARPRFDVGHMSDGEWWQEDGGYRHQRLFVNRDEFVEQLKREYPERTSIYTGNEGMEPGYIYTSAVITLGHPPGDY